MPKKEAVLKYKQAPSGMVGTKATVVSSAVDHGSLAGLGDDDHTQYAAIAQAETITGNWTFTGTVTLDTAAPGADSVNVAASTEGSATTYALSDHTHNLDEAIIPTWTGAHTFTATTTTRTLLPQATDTYDIGSSTLWYSQMFVSQINAAIFAEQQIALLGGWLYVSHDAGTFAAEVESADATVDFGKAMTASDFVIIKAYDISGSIKTEYMQVGVVVAGTVYNVTRDLAAAHGVDPNWAAGTPFAVLGQTGDGRIELNAYDTPRIQMIVQDDAVTYSNTTEALRLGDMNGAFGSDAAGEWGFGVGDYTGGNYMAYNTTDGFEMKAGNGAVRLDDSGLRLLETGLTQSYISWKEDDYETGDTIAYSTAVWDGGAADPVGYFHVAYKATGVSAGDAVLSLGAWDVDATQGWLMLDSGGQLSLGPDHGAIVNANMTVGLCINQATADNEILCFKSSDVAHGATGIANTDTFGYFKKVEAASGGLRIGGLKDADGVAGGAAILEGHLAENADTTKSTAGIGIVHLGGYQTSGTAKANTVADGNVLVVRTYRGGASVTVAIIDEDGDLHLDGTTSAYDEHDDALAVQGLAAGLAQNWNDGLRYNFDALREMGVISGGDREHPFVSTKRMNALVMGAIGQLYERCQRYERALETLGAGRELLECRS